MLLLLLAAAQMLAAPSSALLLLLPAAAPPALSGPMLLGLRLRLPLVLLVLSELLLRVIPKPCQVGPNRVVDPPAWPRPGSVPDSPSAAPATAAPLLAALLPCWLRLANSCLPSVLVRKLRSVLLTWFAMRSSTQGSGVACTAASACSALPTQLRGQASNWAESCASAAVLSSGAEKRSCARPSSNRERSSGQKDCDV